ncbi:MAG: glyoxalase [Chlorobiota bacterium]|nr:glyoxalase [Chlorobiota bacterium]QQS67804.1 MAG: glyoxalase [Chlorobiota bacterium]
MESLTPNIFVKDIQKTIEYYKLLGFDVKITVPKEGEFVWVMMSCNKVELMFQTFNSIGDDLPPIKRNNGGSLLLYIQIKGIREFYNRIKDEVIILKHLDKTFYGATEFSLVDVNNYVLTFAEDE